MSDRAGTSTDVAGSAARSGDARVAERLPDLDALVAAHDADTQDRLGPAIAAGRASHDVERRAALERYAVAKWTTAELPLLIANAPDVYRFTMEDSTHYRHWAERFASQAGYLREPNHVQAALDACRALSLDDAAIRAYVPLPETIAMTCTVLFYLRRSYEEGLAVLAYGGDRIGLPADPEAVGLVGLVATTPAARARCRDALRNVLATVACRVRAMNRWVE